MICCVAMLCCCTIVCMYVYIYIYIYIFVRAGVEGRKLRMQVFDDPVVPCEESCLHSLRVTLEGEGRRYFVVTRALAFVPSRFRC